MQTQMNKEIAQIPDLLQKQISELLPHYLKVGSKLARSNLRFGVTCARGSSDHAALYFNYLAQLSCALPVASVGPSVASVYQQKLDLQNALCLSVSQSGQSQDLVDLQAMAKRGGALTLALLNKPNSPLGNGADEVLPVGAGDEIAVAATKSFVGSLTAIAGLVGGWSEDPDLVEALRALPEVLARALTCDWSQAMCSIARARALFMIARGPGASIAEESALKLKEVCRLHAEAFSAAEVLHGPVALAGDGFCAIGFAGSDEGQKSITQATEAIRDAGGRIFVAGVEDGHKDSLPCATAKHGLLEPISLITSFYLFADRLASDLGENPDKPANLRKVTVTV